MTDEAAPLSPASRPGIWAEVAYAPPGEPAQTFISRIPEDFETSILQAPESAFIRFEFVRFFDESGVPYAKEEDDEVGTDHFFWLKRSLVFCIEPIRGQYVAKWDGTLPEFA